MIIYLVLLLPAGSSDLPKAWRAAFISLLFGLASNGVYMCHCCYQQCGSLLHCLSTLTIAFAMAVYFCCTGLGVASTGRYPASCPAKPGLSSSEPFRLFSRDYLAWLRKCYSSTFFCTCKEISFITVHSVLSNVAKIHFKLPAAMEFWRVNSNFHSTILHIKAASTDKFS